MRFLYRAAVGVGVGEKAHDSRQRHWCPRSVSKHETGGTKVETRKRLPIFQMCRTQ